MQSFDNLKNARRLKSLSDSDVVTLIQKYLPQSVKSPDTNTTASSTAPPPESQEKTVDQGKSPSTETTVDANNDKQPQNSETDDDNAVGLAFSSPSLPSDNSPSRKSSPPKHESEALFREIKQVINSSSIEQQLKDVAINDLEQAYRAYYNTAYKASIVMMGAVLEGLMLGTIRRNDVIDKLRADDNPPRIIRQKGLHHPEFDLDIFKGNIADTMGFQEFKTVIDHLIPEIVRLQVESIQTFRNTIHPWKTIQEPSIYNNQDASRAMNLLTSLEILSQQIVDYNP